jgi:hypothetical protein
MPVFSIVYTSQENDLKSLFQVISHQYQAPLTAYRYIDGLLNSIRILKTIPNAFPDFIHSAYTFPYQHLKRLNYKQMAILFVIQRRTVIIVRIVPANTIR